MVKGLSLLNHEGTAHHKLPGALESHAPVSCPVMEVREGPPCEERLPTPGAEHSPASHPELEGAGAPEPKRPAEDIRDGKKDEAEMEEELDPRIQEELERLNQASEEINQLELQLDDARTAYRRILTESARRLNALATQLGACIEKARPYYEARRLAKEAQQDTYSAALRYERAVSMHSAAREMVFVAEQGVTADKNRLDPTWQEMLNHATCKVNEAEEERLRSEFEHQRVTRQCHQAEAKVQTLQKSLKRVILKSRTYFELKAQFNSVLEEHKARVTSLEVSVSQAKLRYSAALRNLEQISEEIHARRTTGPLLPLRAPPLGAEAPAPVADGEACPSADTVSLLSLQTIASDLQKSDSVEHLRGLSDVTSLDGRDMEPEEEGGHAGRERAADRGSRGYFGHHRSVSL